MPDYSIPLQVQQPNTIGNLAQLVGAAQGMQNLRTQQLQQGILSAETPGVQAQSQIAQRQANTQAIVQKMAQSGVDDQGQSLFLPGTKEIDPAKMAAAMGRIDPVNGAQYADKLFTVARDKAALQGATLALDQQRRASIMGPIQSIATNPSDQQIQGARDALDGLVARNPELAPVAASGNRMLDYIANAQDPAVRQHLANSLAATLQGGEQVQTQPAPASVSTGQQIVQGTTAPPVAGGGFAPASAEAQQLTPGERTQVGISPLSGQPYTIVKPPSGVGAAIGGVGGGATGGTAGGAGGGAATRSVPGNPAPGWPKLGMFPTPQQAQSASDAAKEADSIREADSNPVSGYDSSRQVYSNLVGLVSKNPSIGPKSEAWNQITGALTPFGVSPNANMQEVASYLDRLALQNAGYAGLNTDAARRMAAVAAGTTDMSPAALAEKLRFGAATLEAAHAYRQGMDAVVGTANQNPIAKRAFDAAWAQNADINAFRLQAESRIGDKAGYNATLAAIKKMPIAQQREIFQHAQNIQLLSEGKMPQ